VGKLDSSRPKRPRSKSPETQSPLSSRIDSGPESSPLWWYPHTQKHTLLNCNFPSVESIRTAASLYSRPRLSPRRARATRPVGRDALSRHESRPARAGHQHRPAGIDRVSQPLCSVGLRSALVEPQCTNFAPIGMAVPGIAYQHHFLLAFRWRATCRLNSMPPSASHASDSGQKQAALSLSRPIRAERFAKR
jgi:hypothetical protein